MKIQYEKGDIFESPHRAILHGCNAQGVMGAGFAARLKQEHPYAYKEYRDAYEGGKLHLGTILLVKAGKRLIIHGITQQYYGRENRRYVSYDAIAHVMSAVEETLYGQVVAMPKIGAGLAGGDWNVIASIIESELKTVQPIVYEL
jgi:O-acetyl-ADP-ribose deacetylase (regulator of RNase III)